MHIHLRADEVILGEFHFSGSANVASNEALPLLRFETPEIYQDFQSEYRNGFLNISRMSGNTTTQPLLHVAVFPGRNFGVKISRIEVSMLVESGMPYPVSFSYSNTSDNWQTAKPFVTRTFSHGIASCQKGFELMLQDSIECTDDKGFHLYLTASDLQSISGGKVIGVDYIRFYGPYTDNRVPAILVPAEAQYVGATVPSKPIEKIIDIDYEKLTEEIQVLCNSISFKADFLTIDDGEKNFKQIHIVYTPTEAAFYESADVTLKSGTTVAVFQVKGWGLAENTVAAWNFDTQTITPVYASEGLSPQLQLVGNSESMYFDKTSIPNNRWMLEINNLYSTENNIESPEKSGLMISGLEMNKDYRLRMDVQWRTSAPNTARIGSYDEHTGQWKNSVYWKNPLTALGVTRLNADVAAITNDIYILSAFDQTVLPRSFRPVQAASTFNNTTGWAFDNIIITRIGNATHTIEIANSDITIQTLNGEVFIGNITDKTLIAIYSTDGKLITRKEINGDERIPLAYKGVYIVSVLEKNSTFVRKITI